MRKINYDTSKNYEYLWKLINDGKEVVCFCYGGKNVPNDSINYIALCSVYITKTGYIAVRGNSGFFTSSYYFCEEGKKGFFFNMCYNYKLEYIVPNI